MKKLSSFVLTALLFVSTLLSIAPSAFAIATPDKVSVIWTVPKVATGHTAPGSTNWEVYSDNGIYTDVDTSAANFTQVPTYFTSLGGDSQHWASIKATSTYSPTVKGFRVYLKFTENNINPATANSWDWHIHWIGIEPITDPDFSPDVESQMQ